MRNKAFTMLEVMMALVVVSIMLAVMAPVITASAKPSDKTNVQVMDTTPIGVIVVWYGVNYPSGWLPCDGRNIDDPEYARLREAVGTNALPNLNVGLASTSTSWIIKATSR